MSSVDTGGWWYTSDIINYLNYYSVQNETVSFENSEQILDLIKQGYLIILCIDTSYLRANSNSEERVDRFYSYAGGHFAVVKGVRKVDNSLYFEVYDPNNWGQLYSDGSQKGKNRSYRGVDVSLAISNWWNYLIVVSPSSGGGARSGMLPNRVDPKQIPHMWGR